MHWSEIVIQILLSLIVSTGVVTLIIKGFINNQFRKNLENHKQSLNVILESHKQSLNVLTETKKFDFQRMLHDFNLYRSKKHEIYPELYRLLIQSINELRNLQYHSNWPEFEQYSAQMLEKYLINVRFDEEVIKKYVEQWKLGNKQISFIKQDLKLADLKKAQIDFKSAQDYFHLSELFISVELSLKLHSLFDICEEHLKDLAIYSLSDSFGVDYNSLSEGIEERVNEKKTQIANAFAEINLLLRSELSIADYTPG